MNHSNRQKIMVTGASGFIGRAICRRLADTHDVTAVFNRSSLDNAVGQVRQIDLTDNAQVLGLIKGVKPDVIIHCAGLAHERISSVNRNAYSRLNTDATEYLAATGFENNASLKFIHLSSVSVYGETASNDGIDEADPCNPIGEYAQSKLEAEKRLIRLSKDVKNGSTIILRLAPVYDARWHFNLDRRVTLPGRRAYMRIGTGRQRLSALARPNLVDFIHYLLRSAAESGGHLETYNVCDGEAYSFNELIHVLRNADTSWWNPVLPIPAAMVFAATRVAGALFWKRRAWYHAAYAKLAGSLIYSSKKMTETGFEPIYSVYNTIQKQTDRQT